MNKIYEHNSDEDNSFTKLHDIQINNNCKTWNFFFEIFKIIERYNKFNK